MNIIAISVLVMVALLHQECGLAEGRQVEWRSYNNPAMVPQIMSQRVIARHLLEAEDALAELEAESRALDTCPAPARDSVKVAIEQEIERLRGDPLATAGDESEAISEHRAILAAYDELRQRAVAGDSAGLVGNNGNEASVGVGGNAAERNDEPQSDVSSDTSEGEEGGSDRVRRQVDAEEEALDRDDEGDEGIEDVDEMQQMEDEGKAGYQQDWEADARYKRSYK